MIRLMDEILSKNYDVMKRRSRFADVRTLSLSHTHSHLNSIASSRLLYHFLFLYFQMRSHFTLAVAVLSCLWALNTAASTGNSNNQADADILTSVLTERAARALENIRVVPTNKRSSQVQRGTNIVYGKGRIAEQPKFTSRHTPKKPINIQKFSASDDAGNDGDNPFPQQFKLSPQDTLALQKYMQKYANQLYSAQKHSAQLSETQKLVLGQDPYAKKYVVTPHKHKHVVKYIPTTQKPEIITAAEPSKFQEDSFESIEPTEKYHNYQVQQKLAVHTNKAAKAPPKKAYSHADNTPQSSDHRFSGNSGFGVSETHVNQYLGIRAASPDRAESFSSLEPQAYIQFGTSPTDKAAVAEGPKITGYKIPGALSLNVAPTLEEKGGHHDHHEEHYPTVSFI